MATFFIQPKIRRPEFRTVIAFLWRESQNVDTEGDSYDPNSLEWTELYCMNRECPEEVFEVSPSADEPLTLRIDSNVSELAARVAYYLATNTESLVAANELGPWHSPDWLIDQVGNFDLARATERARQSRRRRSSPEDPYPEVAKER
jgi:hypothetical protein